MWTSSYLPTRGKVFVAALVCLLSLGLLAQLWLQRRQARPVRSCGCRLARPAPARLSLDGTPGACVRMDGRVVGPLPTSIEFTLSRPRQVFLAVCRSGHQDYVGPVVLRPGVETQEQIWLPRLQDVGAAGRVPAGPVPLSPCTCEE